MGKVQLNSTSGSITLTPQDGSGNVDVVIPREQLVGVSSLATKQNTLVSGTNIKTINGSSILGNGDVSLINLSGITAYHLLQGNLAVSTSTTTQGFNTTLYTGNGSTQSITTGIDMDTQWGNNVSERFGGLVWGKSRSNALDNALYDTIRGVQNYIFTNSTAAQVAAGGNGLSSFNNNGFSIGSGTALNTSAATYASWNFQTTHRVTGTTNHGQTYTCHYNPYTGFTMVQYTGSGIAGHEIPHMFGRKLSFAVVKGTSRVDTWYAQYKENVFLCLNTTAAEVANTTQVITAFNETTTQIGNGSGLNGSGSTYIMYGWANSYFDKANKLIGNYEVGVYQGTGASGNKVTTRGKPAWIMIKRLDSSAYWWIGDNKRGNGDLSLYANATNAEADDANDIDINNDGFTITNTGNDTNTSGGQYLYMVVYDTNSNGGGSYYPLASDTANLQVNNALIPFANGIDSNGAKNTILSKNETITGLTYTEGKNYVYCDNTGAYGVSNKAPNYGTVNPANGGDFYNVLSNKWFTSAGVAITNSRNYMNHIVYADNDGGLLYVEELPKIEYKDIVKANEYKGKNACTAWVNFDGTTTPPTIRDSYNVKSVVRSATGMYDIYFKEPMDRTNYSQVVSINGPADSFAFPIVSSSGGYGENLNDVNKCKVSVLMYNATAWKNASVINVEIKGGKN